MIDLNATLNNLIAMVVVLLALSLVVQAVQSAIKKMFKLKSRQIEDSLAHLLQYVLSNKTSAAVTPKGDSESLWADQWKGLNAMLAQSPFLRVFLRWLSHPAEAEGYKEATALYNEVVNRFRAIGRTAFSTRPIFDSLSKSDLMRVIASIDPAKLDNAFSTNIGAAVESFKSFFAVFRQWEGWFDSGDFKTAVAVLSDDDKAKLVALQAKLKPLVDDVRLLLTGETGAGVVISSLAGDIARLRAINLDDMQDVLDDVNSHVAKAALQAKADNKPDVANTLNDIAARLKSLSDGFKAFRLKYNAVFANWAKLEDSFDVVMQSFEERYTRSMKTAAIIIGFIVVIFLNANFFKVYQAIATSDTTRELILQSRADVVDAINKANPITEPAATTTPPVEQGAQNAPDAAKKAQDAAKKAREEQINDEVATWFNASKAQINSAVGTFEGYGFAPITWQDTKNWFLGTLFTGTFCGDRECFWAWWDYRKHDLKVLIGWTIMALLLSVGAPFWQDFLESLFGVKNVLRKKSQTENVEQAPGAGQTKQA